MDAEFSFLGQPMQAPGTAHAQLRVLKPQRNSRPWITAVFVAFAEKGLLQRKAISRRPQAVPLADRPYLPPRAPVVRPRHAHFDDALLAMMTHCLQSKSKRQGRRRRGETKAWHAQRRAPPPRRRRRQGHQRESRVGG